MARRSGEQASGAGASSEALAAAVALAPRIFRPRRGRLREARAVVERHARAADAWGALIDEGLVPGGWGDDPRRRFGPRSLCGACALGRDEGEGTTCLRCYHAPRTGRLRAHPVSRQMAARVASDVEGVERAEALAREAARRLASPGVRVPDAVLWRTVEAPSWRGELLGSDDTDWMTASPIVYASSPRLAEQLEGDEAVERVAAHHDLMLVAADRLSLLGDGDRPGTPVGALGTMLLAVVASRAWTTVTPGVAQKQRAARASSPDPFASLCELGATGYLLEAITDRFLVLASPRRRPRPGVTGR